MWTFSARVTDESGVDRVSLKEGNGTMTTSPDPANQNLTLVSYSSSCCSPTMELLVVDRVGNVGTCTINSSVSLSTQSLFLFLMSTMTLGFVLLTN